MEPVRSFSWNSLSLLTLSVKICLHSPIFLVLLLGSLMSEQNGDRSTGLGSRQDLDSKIGQLTIIGRWLKVKTPTIIDLSFNTGENDQKLDPSLFD